MMTRHVVRNFDPERLKAPFLLRAGAFLIDYLILIMVPVLSMLLARFTGLDGAKLLNSEINNTGWLIMILLAVTNFVIFPLFSGQTIGKMLTGIRIVKFDGTSASFSRLLMRSVVGYPVTLLTFGLGLIVAVFSSTGRTLHDFMAGTMVVYGKRQIERKDLPGKPGRRTDGKDHAKRLAVATGGARTGSSS